jgi:hypothetical protein
MNLKVRSALSVLVIAAVVVTSSCSAVLGTLEGIVDGAAALVPILTAASAAGQIPDPTATIVMDYLEAASTAASNSITEWESNDPDSVKIAVIAADFAAVAAPSLGAGLSPVIQASISSISKLITQLVGQISASQGSLVAHGSGAPRAHSAVLALHILDKHRLHELKSHADKNVAAIEAWKARQRVKAAASH